MDAKSNISCLLAAAACALNLPAAGCNRSRTCNVPAAPASAQIRHVFVIVMENRDWAHVKDSPSAPYINGTLLPQASYAEAYRNLPGLHPSLPNYLWMEAGTNFGIRDNDMPAIYHQATPNHLVALLRRAGIDWKAYQEDIDGASCPLVPVARYMPRHNPVVYFDDVTSGNDPGSAECIARVRPYGELARDLAAGTVARYNFITPNLCNDMHDSLGCPTPDPIRNGDDWLSRELPNITASRAFRDGGAVFLTWDESEGADVPIGMIVLSPFAKGGGYSNQVEYTHGSLLRTLQEIFGVYPLLGDACNATALGDLFVTFP